MVTEKKETAISKDSFFAKHKAFVIGSIFVLTVVLIGAFMFTQSSGGFTGQFTKVAEGAEVDMNFHGLDELNYVGTPFVNEGDEFKLYLGIEDVTDGNTVAIHSLSFYISFDFDLFTLKEINQVPDILPAEPQSAEFEDDDRVYVEFTVGELDPNDPAASLKEYAEDDDIIEFVFEAKDKGDGIPDCTGVTISDISMSTIRDVDNVQGEFNPDEIFRKDGEAFVPETICVWAPCIETDLGDDRWVFGECTDTDENGDPNDPVSDVCVANQDQVKEYYCDEGVCVSDIKDCDLNEECISGRCVVPGEECVDSDVGDNAVYIFGHAKQTVNGIDSTKYDECADKTHVREYSCDAVSKTIVWDDIECPGGRRCVDGACVALECGNVKVDYELDGITPIIDAGDLTMMEKAVARQITHDTVNWIPDLPAQPFPVSFANADVDLNTRVAALDITSLSLYLITLWTMPPECSSVMCGDEVVELPEECDDGNLVDDDACSNICEDGVDDGKFHGDISDGNNKIEFNGPDEIIKNTAGVEFNLTLMQGTVKLNSISFDIIFDHTKFTLTDVSTDGTAIEVDSNTNGNTDSYLLAVPGNDDTFSVDDNIITFTFTAVNAESDNNEFKVEDLVIVYDNNNVPAYSFQQITSGFEGTTSIVAGP